MGDGEHDVCIGEDAVLDIFHDGTNREVLGVIECDVLPDRVSLSKPPTGKSLADDTLLLGMFELLYVALVNSDGEHVEEGGIGHQCGLIAFNAIDFCSERFAMQGHGMLYFRKATVQQWNDTVSRVGFPVIGTEDIDTVGIFLETIGLQLVAGITGDDKDDC